MNWKRMLAYVTGSVDEELLARNEYLVTENRILRGLIKGRIRLTDPEVSLRVVLSNYVAHFHGERNHQGQGNVILFSKADDRIGESTGQIQTRQRLGGLLKFYYRDAA